MLDKMGHSRISCWRRMELGFGQSWYSLSRASTCSGVYRTYLPFSKAAAAAAAAAALLSLQDIAISLYTISNIPKKPPPPLASIRFIFSHAIAQTLGGSRPYPFWQERNSELLKHKNIYRQFQKFLVRGKQEITTTDCWDETAIFSFTKNKKAKKVKITPQIKLSQKVVPSFHIRSSIHRACLQSHKSFLHNHNFKNFT